MGMMKRAEDHSIVDPGIIGREASRPASGPSARCRGRPDGDGTASSGARMDALDLPGDSNPWHEGFGMFRDDPLFDDWQHAIIDNRRIVDDSAERA